MIIPDRKKAVTVILSKMGAGGEEKASASVKPEEDMEGSALHTIAQDILMAIESKSAADLAQALSAFVGEADSDESEEG